MVTFHIREYRTEDYETVRDLFATGMSEYVPTLCVHMLKQPWLILILSCTFCLLLTSSRSLLLPILAVTLLLAMGRQLLGYVWSRYIDHCLQEDLLDIQATYMDAKGSCFWVAEVDECVVATVGARPSEEHPAELMLKRMSVRKDYRGLGIAKALCKTVISFAQEHNYQAVMLNTLMVQHEAHSLYRSVGFHVYRHYILPTIYAQQECDSIMAEYHIRTYEDRDREAVCTMFSYGIQEHAQAGCWYFLRCVQTHVLLLSVFLVAHLIWASLLFSLVVAATVLFMGWIYMKGLWTKYVQAALATDLKDIPKAYLEPKDCCFWVATSGKEVVGMVAAAQPEDPSYQGHALELKRMSVAKEHRGRGLSKALTRTVIRFARERGYKEVVLGTSMVQYAAQRVYEGIGFRKVNVASPSLLTKLVDFSVYYYCYQITGSH